MLAAKPAPQSAFPLRVIVLIAVASTVLSLSMGLRQSLGLFLRPINADLGVSAAAFGFALALQNIVWGLSQPVVGVLGDRYGARPVLIASALVYAAGLLLMAFGGPALGLDIGGGVIAGIGIAGTSFGVLLGAVSRAVPAEQRSQMVGLVSAAGSLGTLVLAPLGQVMITEYGWRTALLAFAGIALLMGAVGALIGRPATTASTPGDGEAAASTHAALLQAAGHRGYIAMAVSFFACGFQLMFITTHLPQFLAICGLAPSVGASALGLIGLGNAAGSYVVGLLGARYSQKRLLALIYLLRTLAIAVYLAAPISAASTLVFAATMGVLWLSVAPLVSGLIGRMFGLRHFNTLFGLTFLSHQVGAFVGAWLGGVTFDLTGSYATAWTSMLVVGLAAAALQWSMDDRATGAGRPNAALTAGRAMQDA
ncbi:MFS transporter [Bradyrhizobium sp. Leo170]|uniref:MFS transporter n=1 Tax=Bradyrhizobium sp. Leo170 TaxID=1571199 RepID=UPI00102E4A7E|nr:MFS transporter [Bradyrhizobium sp. Leo170]TAI61636.1 MFS transporter [Bradyrhizobium sp. Leo170]